MSLTRIELEQLRNSRFYDDTLSSGPAAESGVTFSDDLNQIVSAVRRILGTSNWYDAPTATLDALAAASGQANESQTWTDVYNLGSGILNTSSFDSDIRLPDGITWRFNNASGINPIMEVTNNQILARNIGERTKLNVPVDINVGDTITIPDGLSYTPDPNHRNLEVHRNQGLLLPGSGIVETDENFADYREVDSTTIVTNVKIKSKEVLQFRIYG